MSIAVLCVEDDDNNAYLLQWRLARDGLAVHHVASAEEGLRALARRDYALILLDLKLPGMDGWAFLETVRRGERPSDVPIIVLSAHVLKDEAERALAAGANAFLPKPLDFRRLREAIERALPSWTRGGGADEP